MQSVEVLFADYAEHHRTAGNKAFHRAGIPLIVMTLLGLLSRIELAHAGAIRLDAAILLLIAAVAYYMLLEWRLGVVMTAFSMVLYFVGREIPVWTLWVLFVTGWILQFVGHSVYEKRQPAFFRNLLHLLVGPLWIVNDVVPIIPRSPAREPLQH